MRPLSELVRPNIWALAPYSTARDDYQGGDIDVWLDANENPYDTEWNRYPDPHQRALKARISEIKGMPVEQIFIGNGSDEAIDLAYRIFCTPGRDNAVVMAPSYGMYSVAADTNDVKVREVQLNPDFSLPVDRMLAAADENTKLMIICSPNNPTGNAFPLEDIECLLDSFDGIVVVDEAYIDFSDRGSVLSVLAKHPNAIVLQTLSKAWGMAALRVGLAFASREIMALYAKVKYPYNISRINQLIALGSLASVDEQVAEIKSEREKLAQALKACPSVLEVYPSDANFLLVKVNDANAWYDRLMEGGIIVRNRSKMPLCSGCLRITVGTPEENARVCEAFGSSGSSGSSRSSGSSSSSGSSGSSSSSRSSGSSGSSGSSSDSRIPESRILDSRFTNPPNHQITQSPTHQITNPPTHQITNSPRRALFVDRDGTIIVEPVIDEQVDSLEKLEFIPGAISGLAALRRLDYDLVMATNQDGLGTPCFPTEDFEKPHQKMLKTLEGEGVTWDDQLIDEHFPSDHSPMRKPGIGMFGKYMDGSYDLANSYVIGDRLTDMQLAKNLGAKGILLENPQSGEPRVKEAGLEDTVVLVTDSWAKIADYVRVGSRRATIRRTTRETDIEVTIDLDNRAEDGWKVDTGLKFLDHMLDQIAHHGGVGLNIRAKGDLQVDEHHTMEDVAITLGQTIAKALGNKAGIGRYGFALPMDDCRAIVLLDFGGRIDLEWDVEWKREYVGDTPTEMMRHFFMSLCAGAQCNMYVQARGDNEHHKAEAIFKALARALKMAIARQPFAYDIPSSKGLL